MGLEFSPVLMRCPASGGNPRELGQRESLPMLLLLAGGGGTVIKFGEFIMILELHRQGLKIAAIARQLRVDRKTVPQIHLPRSGAASLWSSTAPDRRAPIPFCRICARLAAFPGLTAMRLWRELRER